MNCQLKVDYEIGFDNIDFTGRLSLNGISKCMQDVAGRHADELGINFFINHERPNCYWIISRVKYEMTAYPKVEEQFSMTTYPGGYDKLFAVRLFDICNGKGEKIGRIIGDYLLMDIEKKRPIRIKGGEGGLKYLDFPYEGEKLGRLMPKEGALIAETVREAFYYEIDLNEHMNNSHYVRWALDMLPLELLKQNEVASLEIEYNQSITFGVKSKLTLTQDADGKYWIVGKSLDDEIQFFVSAITLRKRENV